MTPPPNRPLRLIQISDLHLVEPGQLLRKSIDSRAKARRAIDKAKTLSPDALIFSGDIGQRGNDVHDEAAEVFAQLAEELAIPIISIGGNHDPVDAVGPQHCTERVSSGPRPANGVYHVGPAGHEADQTGQHAGVRIITLDTNGVGERFGHVEQAQLDWLNEVLDEPHPGGTVVVMHHSPIEATTGAQRGSGLHSLTELEQVLTDRGVRAILAGHFHHQIAGPFAGIPVWTAPAVAYNFNLGAPVDELHAADNGFITIVTLNASPDEAVTFSLVDIDEKPPAFSKYAGSTPRTK